jgi:hypothetical protein
LVFVRAELPRVRQQLNLEYGNQVLGAVVHTPPPPPLVLLLSTQLFIYFRGDMRFPFHLSPPPPLSLSFSRR